jgi:hypothetical protein
MTVAGEAAITRIASNASERQPVCREKRLHAKAFTMSQSPILTWKFSELAAAFRFNGRGPAV